MELLFLGTAAAEAWPAPYCDCVVCAEARRRGGPNLRSRPGYLFDDDLKIDHGPDTAVQMMRAGKSLAKLQTILFTHDHQDHIYASDLRRASFPYTTTRPKTPIAVYGNEPVLAEIRRQFPEPENWSLDLRPLRPFEAVQTPTGDVVLPLPAAHCPHALIFRITRGGKHILIGHDTGIFPAETVQGLCDGTALDVALFDCTHGPQATSNKGHLDIGGMLRVIESLRQGGAIGSQTRIVATHFSHNGKMLHEELVETLLPHNIRVAYDGMRMMI